MTQSTLARDVKHFINAGYKINKTILIDMFPQTYHIESIVILENTNKVADLITASGNKR